MMEHPTVEQMMEQAQHLSAYDRVRLIQWLAETLLQFSPAQPSEGVAYGRDNGENVSNQGDATIAEWHPTEKETGGEYIEQ